LCLLLCRPYRKARNRVVILLCQLFVAISALGGLFLVQKFEVMMELRDKSARESAVLAFLFGLIVVEIFVLRAEFRWRRASGLTHIAAAQPSPVPPGAKRRYYVALAMMASSWAFTIPYLFYKTRPLAPLLVGFSLFSFLAPMILFDLTFAPAQMREIRKSSVIVVGLAICFIGFVAFKSRDHYPAQTPAWLITLTLLCILFLRALFHLKPDSGIRSS
jgi:hypothetical protein